MLKSVVPNVKLSADVDEFILFVKTQGINKDKDRREDAKNRWG